jgi:hypothetical protein
VLVTVLVFVTVLVVVTVLVFVTVLVVVLVLVPVPVLAPVVLSQIWSTHVSYRLFAWHDTRTLAVPDGVVNMPARLPHSNTGAEPLRTARPSTPLPAQPLPV